LAGDRDAPTSRDQTRPAADEHKKRVGARVRHALAVLKSFQITTGDISFKDDVCRMGSVVINMWPEPSPPTYGWVQDGRWLRGAAHEQVGV